MRNIFFVLAAVLLLLKVCKVAAISWWLIAILFGIGLILPLFVIAFSVILVFVWAMIAE